MRNNSANIFISMCLMAMAAFGCSRSTFSTSDVGEGGEPGDVTAEAEPDTGTEPDAAPDTDTDPVSDPVIDGVEPVESPELPDLEMDTEFEVFPDLETEPEIPARCPLDDDMGPGEHEIEVTHDGIAHTSLVYVPAVYDSSEETPLIVNMHGYMLSGRNQSEWSNMNATADERGFVAVYPNGYNSSWNGGTCCGQASTDDIDDVGFMKALVAFVSERLCIDPARVYATGLSNGGYMSNRLGCDAGDVFAAVAPVAGAIGIEDCSPERPMPVIIYHGTNDWLVAYADGEAAFAEWVEHNGCVGDPVRTEYGGSYCDAYEDCEGGVKTVMCTLDPMGHCWPGGSESHCFFAIGPYNDDINANNQMFDFFLEFPLP